MYHALQFLQLHIAGFFGVALELLWDGVVAEAFYLL